MFQASDVCIALVHGNVLEEGIIYFIFASPSVSPSLTPRLFVEVAASAKRIAWSRAFSSQIQQEKEDPSVRHKTYVTAVCPSVVVTPPWTQMTFKFLTVSLSPIWISSSTSSLVVKIPRFFYIYLFYVFLEA
jgi:hypothetical protein